MERIAAQVLIDRLADWGVDTVFGILANALAHRGPALVGVAVDPNEPPMPGKVSYEQARKFRRLVPARAAAPGGDRHDAVQGQDPAAAGRAMTTVTLRAPAIRAGARARSDHAADGFRIG